MTLVASWGGNITNSYVGMSDASSFITTGIILHNEWDSATEVQREAALVAASKDLDSRNYIGARYYYDQTMLFPRAFPVGFPWNRTASSSTVFSVEQRRMQVHVQQATCYQALWLLRMSGRNFHLDNIAMGIKTYRERTGPLDDSVEYRAGANRLCPEAITLISPWMEPKRIVRG